MAAKETALRLAARAYGSIVQWRNATYDRWPARSRRLPVPVVSVGNITVGGTGKTPMAALVVQSLAVWGFKPAIVTRGYMPKRGAVSDEVLELRQRLRDVPVIVNPRRYRGGLHAIAEGATAIVLDDGFQHRQLRRDFDLVLIDATEPFGDGAMLPAGRLREPLPGLERADAIIITRCNHVTGGVVDEIVRELTPLTNARIVRSELTSAGLLDADRHVVTPAMQRVLVACAVGNPSNVVTTAQLSGLEVEHLLTWRDHHSYRESDLDVIADYAARHNAEAVVVTAKDWVKLRELDGWKALNERVPIWRLVVNHKLIDGDPLMAAIREACLARVGGSEEQEGESA